MTCPLFWCEKRDLNPYGKTTRPSNVRVCQFRHSREQWYYTTKTSICQVLFAKFPDIFSKSCFSALIGIKEMLRQSRSIRFVSPDRL